jgi:hypothetical protein
MNEPVAAVERDRAIALEPSWLCDRGWPFDRAAGLAVIAEGHVIAGDATDLESETRF